MNIGFWLCGVLVIPFVIIGVLFAIFKEKAAKFVSGFNSLPKEEQALYDKAHISRDIKNQCFTWAGIMLVGAVLSYFLTPYMAIPAFIIWLVLFFKEVRFLYKGIIIKHNKTEPTYTKTSLFLCEKRRFFMARTEKGVVTTI